jgi:hypothetical protein
MSLKPTSVPTKTLLTSITSGSLEFRLNNIKGWSFPPVDLVPADFGIQGYCVMRNANRTKMELMEFNPATINNPSITIVKRGLKFDGDRITEVPAYKLSWTKGDTFVDLGTDTPQLWQYLKDYIDGIAIAGSPNASETAKGLVEEATQDEVTAGTDIGATGAKLFVSPSKLDLPKCHLFQNLSSTINSGLFNVQAFQLETFDNDLMHDNAINNTRITFKTAGAYSFGANITAVGQLQLMARIILNATTVLAGDGTVSFVAAPTPVNVSGIYQFAVNDYIEVSVSGNGTSSTTGDIRTNFWAFKL